MCYRLHYVYIAFSFAACALRSTYLCDFELHGCLAGNAQRQRRPPVQSVPITNECNMNDYTYWAASVCIFVRRITNILKSILSNLGQCNVCSMQTNLKTHWAEVQNKYTHLIMYILERMHKCSVHISLWSERKKNWK